MKSLPSLVLCCLVSFLYSAPVGNPMSPKLIEKGAFSSQDARYSVRMGYLGDFVTDGRYKQSDQGQGRVDEFIQINNGGTVTLSFVHRLDLYTTLEASKAWSDWRFQDSSNMIHLITLETDCNFLWLVGARAILYEWGNVSLGAGGNYSACNYQLQSIQSDGVFMSTAGSQFQWYEWQANIDLSYHAKHFTPYIGTKYSKTQADRKAFRDP